MIKGQGDITPAVLKVMQPGQAMMPQPPIK